MSELEKLYDELRKLRYENKQLKKENKILKSEVKRLNDLIDSDDNQKRKFLPNTKIIEKICILKPKNQENRKFRLCMKEQFKAVLFLFFDVL